MSDTPAIPAPAPLLVDAREAAALCGVGKSLWWSLTAQGRTPAKVRLGRCTRWNRRELLAWIEAGCPCRDRWELIGRGARRG
jgi:predicted DNA-binding transcriptional regulator AlpA